MRVAAVILAAGESRRFGSAKLAEPLGGKPLLQHVIDAANASSCHDVVVVLGDGADDLVARIHLGRALAVMNTDYAEGQSTSLRTGVRGARGSDAVVVLLGDQPRVTAALIDAVIERQAATRAAAVMCSWNERRSPPTLLRRDLFPELEQLTGDVGAREVLRDRDDVAILDVTPDLGSLEDVDRPADLDALRG